MANKRDIKKDINFLAEEIIQTSFLQYFLKKNSDEENESISKTIEDTVALRNELIYKVNHPELKSDNQSVKSYYTEISSVMIEYAEKVLGNLGIKDI
jgi:vacuolar-type H+-ATPase subunit D/Vma8